MKAKKVNAELYLKIREAVERGDYTVEEAVVALGWVRSECIRKWNLVLDAIKVNEIKHFDDWYDEYHSKEEAPEVN
ncbi:MAG: hypothetical protein HFF17_15520 [Oscillospiraceae bacterium]|nr:hypothetical protein [Oscillospiraceae bacterium]